MRTNSSLNPEQLGSEMGLEFYLFVGGVTDDTLPFCREKVGKFYHFKEIMEWASENWEGKNPATNEQTIFQYVGGNCSQDAFDPKCHHALMPVSEFAVPREDLIRAYKKGYYHPSDYTKKTMKI